MELVYLWVEDYKNIKNQGFNFSPRFECKFHDKYEKEADGKEKLKDNCILDIQPKNYIKNFFGENINVTAIVGENGSGKSSLIEAIKIAAVIVYFYKEEIFVFHPENITISSNLNHKRAYQNNIAIYGDQSDFKYICLSSDLIRLTIPHDYQSVSGERIEYCNLYHKTAGQNGTETQFNTKEFSKTITSKYNDLSKNIVSFDIKKDFEQLSQGERKFAIEMTMIRNAIDSDSKAEILMLLDEPDVALHPKWQKEYLKKLINTISDSNRKIHIIVTTHSPFILSDIPKQNVIFLEDGKQVYPDIDTFGANIHTLLSHGFFMKDGLMGEFAKGKINEAIKYLNQKTLTKKEIDYCENIISIISEPILKRQLQKMLDSKRLTKIEDIDKKIKDMEYELSVLKKHQSRTTNDEIKDRAKRKYSKKKKDDK